ncbi:DUF1553 domain-containing protein [Luteolibacter algae]|uniref:DUF1553 domain-containing protein n=1 Tax=Luteolibacter algae TaxID=454151 RepID=A0ABW5D4R9_9BACT
MIFKNTQWQLWQPLLLVVLLAGCKEKTIVFHHETAEKPAKVSGEMILPEEISFNEHIQPILSEYCYHCHGPDAGTRRPDKEPLRLDVEEDAFQVRDFGAPVIVKGKPEESELIKLIKSTDQGDIMPPPESHKVMGKREIALLEKWILQGAEYEGHWSYEPISKPEPVENDWSGNPIDSFVLEKMAEAGLKPNPDEEVRRFHRRLSFDLTGLPPEPAETDRFAEAYRKDAEAAVSAEADRMLGTMQSAEQFARHWLDAARYADTHGIHIDNYRGIWPYRDWVVNAFHRNMPWDQFTKEQIAGDLLPSPTLDQQVATGFNRCLSTTGEGGAIAEEYEAIYAADRVDTVGAIWLGLTASCASCHDHKFDPFSTKEFYQLTAFFRNNTMPAMDRNAADHPPTIFVPIPDDREQFAQLSGKKRQLQGKLKNRRELAESDFQSWLVNAGKVQAPEPLDHTLVLHLPMNEGQGGIKGNVDGAEREWAADVERIDGPLGKAIVVSKSGIELGDIGGFARRDQVSYGGFVYFKGKPTGAIIAKMEASDDMPGWDLFIDRGKIGGHIIEKWQKSANRFLTRKPVQSGQWHHLMVTFDGTKPGYSTMKLYVDGEMIKGKPGPNSLEGEISNSVPLRLGSREGGRACLSEQVALQDFRMYRRVLTQAEIAKIANSQKISYWISLPEEQRTKKQTESLFEHFLATADKESMEISNQIGAVDKELAPYLERGSTTLVFEEKKNEKPFAHVLVRGAYSSLGEKVFPDTPAMLPPMSKDVPKNRLGLAEWLNDPANPLPARVTMNRLWSYVFGTGLVPTTGDFGIMGERPSHPKLLDWLASEFIASGWDYRHMAKLIVMSKTYRQSGVVSPEKLEADPANRLLSRGPRIRLEAEQIRDMALHSAELLSLKVGGAPVKPYQPEGIWEAVAMPQSNTRHYKQDSGEALYRRSIYTFWKRTAAPPAMEILNAPTRETFCVRRDVTNTPLQALALMNDPQFVEAGRVLAENAVERGEDFDAGLDHISLRLLDRRLNEVERSFVKETYQAAEKYYGENPDEAELAIAVGETKPDGKLPAPELAAWTLVAGQLFNLDETITK